MENLTERDFELILDGLDAIKFKDMAGDMMSTLLKGMLTKDDPAARAEFEQQMKKDQANKERERRQMEERIIILKAKIIQLKDSTAVNSLITS